MVNDKENQLQKIQRWRSDPVAFVEDICGIQLLPHQKVLLRTYINIPKDIKMTLGECLRSYYLDLGALAAMVKYHQNQGEKLDYESQSKIY